MSGRLKKSRTEKMIAGVCGGIAEHFGWDPTVVRIAFVVGAFFGFGSTVLIYFLLAFIMPE